MEDVYIYIYSFIGSTISWKMYIYIITIIERSISSFVDINQMLSCGWIHASQSCRGANETNPHR